MMNSIIYFYYNSYYFMKKIPSKHSNLGGEMDEDHKYVEFRVERVDKSRVKHKSILWI